ncbi:MAG: outer membrane lipoprotein carrier protein LolA [Candidatus Accumulibacter sp.]|jgi:outer membrane lipoprotein-sorting protein|nr:outer membrane lipoprotein carrier protein LolA [Accumulibacter sp.]
MNTAIARRALAALCFFLVCAAVHAEDVLRNIQSQLVLEPVIRGEFTQTRKLAQIKKTLVSRGRFLVAQNYGVIWKQVSPMTQTTRLTGDEIVQTDGQVTLMKVSADQEPVLKIVNGVLFAVFSGDLAALAQHFDYSGNVENNGWRIRFTPRDANLARLIGELRLTGGRDISSIEMESAAGDLTRIEFSALTHDQTLSGEEKKRFE